MDSQHYEQATAAPNERRKIDPDKKIKFSLNWDELEKSDEELGAYIRGIAEVVGDFYGFDE